MKIDLFSLLAANMFGFALLGTHAALYPLSHPVQPPAETRDERLRRREREMREHYERLATRHAERKAKRPTRQAHHS